MGTINYNSALIGNCLPLSLEYISGVSGLPRATEYMPRLTWEQYFTVLEGDLLKKGLELKYRDGKPSFESGQPVLYQGESVDFEGVGHCAVYDKGKLVFDSNNGNGITTVEGWFELEKIF